MTAAPRAWRERSAWVFDLDNTLYPAESALYDQIGARITAYMARLLELDLEAAHALQRRYLLDYGATLAGLMAVHGAAPEPFLDFVHDIDLSPVAADPALGALIAALPGKKIVFTNGGRAHAARITARLGIDHAFDALFAIEDAEFTPKPAPEAFTRLIGRHGMAPRDAVMFEDLARNLEPAHALGFTTVLVKSPTEPAAEAGAHVHHVTDCLKSFLRGVLA